MDEIGVATLLTKLGFEEGMRRIGVDSFSSVVKCWWLNEEANCSEMFFNHFTDYSFCFTFNPSGKIISTETNHSGNRFSYFLHQSIILTYCTSNCKNANL